MKVYVIREDKNFGFGIDTEIKDVFDTYENAKLMLKEYVDKAMKSYNISNVDELLDVKQYKVTLINPSTDLYINYVIIEKSVQSANPFPTFEEIQRALHLQLIKAYSDEEIDEDWKYFDYRFNINGDVNSYIYTSHEIEKLYETLKKCEDDQFEIELYGNSNTKNYAIGLNYGIRWSKTEGITYFG